LRYRTDTEIGDWRLEIGGEGRREKRDEERSS
jgi:hypothetical protein